ncbi:dihydrodipicolinate synthetase family protein [Plectosphaerella cucumerina]|uniref:Dihydrodipicolinate synthetase family protein n=1 Tax=Plectosphaerella cucumerina TaxID=40658 RepID=A0A8K0X8S7_9PEZI|nr:dihydrodipicolinate synthetase family protein [Plectosphaerella cucumerina]
MASILSCPPEITLLILSQFDSFSDIVALAKTCKRLHSLWLAVPPTIIWCIAPSRIPAFDEALMAVRATNLVKPAFRNGHMPPRIDDLASLSGASTKPTLSELIQVIDLQHLVRCLQHMFYFSNDSDNGESQWTTHVNLLGDKRLPCWSQLDSPGKRAFIMKGWFENFSRASYRLFLAGAVLAHAYHEPYFIKRRQDDSTPLSAVYSYRVDIEKDAGTFGPLCDWIVNATRVEASRRKFVPVWRRPMKPEPAGDDESDYEDDRRIDRFYEDLPDDDDTPDVDTSNEDIFGLWNVMAMLAAYELTRIRFYDPPKNSRPTYSHWSPHETYGQNMPEVWLPKKRPDELRKVTVILFGDFHLKEITMPATVEDSKNILLACRRIVPPEQPLVPAAVVTNQTPCKKSRPLYFWNIPERLWNTPLPEDLDVPHQWPAPALELKFLSHMLRVTWNEKIEPQDPNWLNSSYRDFIADGNVFHEYKYLYDYGLHYLERYE